MSSIQSHQVRTRFARGPTMIGPTNRARRVVVAAWGWVSPMTTPWLLRRSLSMGVVERCEDFRQLHGDRRPCGVVGVGATGGDTRHVARDEQQRVAGREDDLGHGYRPCQLPQQGQDAEFAVDAIAASADQANFATNRSPTRAVPREYNGGFPGMRGPIGITP